ncbi:ribonuclease HI family protein [Nocardioides sp. Soil805]|uniref:ribonuclease HI family protein n=1 Tax=Nocardioides sp. Soil805 TaxID=1736416 RepID=UPI000B18A41B|nr:ribonuclease HI family protein [Nocardioides sp. Soil805]
MIIAAADGSALGNPGPAGWAWYVDDDCWASGGWARGTNNMGELMAVLDLLQQTAHVDDELHVYCDSTYVINTITKWMAGWKRKGWKKGDGKPVMNLELIQALDAAMQGRRVKFEWVKGHSGHVLNEAADRRANAAAAAYQAGRVADPGPGFAGASGRSVPQAGPTVVEEEPDLFSDLDDAGSDVSNLSDEEQVIALERAALTDEVRSDRGAMAALLHPEWQEIGQSGRLWTREELLAEMGPLGVEISLDVVSTERLSPDTILLLWRSITDDGSVLRSSLWVRTSHGWQQRFHQGTREA